MTGLSKWSEQVPFTQLTWEEAHTSVSPVIDTHVSIQRCQPDYVIKLINVI